MNTKRIYSKTSEEIWLATSPATWSALPLSLKLSLLEGIERVAAARREIAGSAKVKSMPPVEVITEILRSPKNNDPIDRVGSQLLKTRDAMFVGVRLPAPTVLCEAVLRPVLVHEFAHCFR